MDKSAGLEQKWEDGHIFTKILDEKKGMVILCGIIYAGVLTLAKAKS
ncbi:hypothetical protein [Brevibacillus brevis]|uniref:Uncharacterized protein n=1 Tax=Brevibacillus brevis TaxID=1393 RepID=A0ABY9SYA2_BREBE|nr:hypothetical protein [Brevibacillus brevis]WNC12815.1 hypothetical protein RGB73_19035 [Brevibacillus brevis]